MTSDDVIAKAKEYLSKDEHRIQLHDTVVGTIKSVAAQTAGDTFRVQGVGWSDGEFLERIARYDQITRELCAIEALLGYWAGPANRPIIALAPRRLVEPLAMASGTTGWIALRWYPALLLLYSGGIAAAAAERYDNLRELLQARVSSRRGEPEPLIFATTSALADVAGAFKLLPGHGQHNVPRSEYLFTVFRPIIDDLLFLGADYEDAFDRFEVMLSLEYAHLVDRDWAPIGRFGWKADREGGPLGRLLNDAAPYGNNWPPLRAGLFGGSVERLTEVAGRISRLVGRQGWS